MHSAVELSPKSPIPVVLPFVCAFSASSEVHYAELLNRKFIGQSDRLLWPDSSLSPDHTLGQQNQTIGLIAKLYIDQDCTCAPPLVTPR